MGEKKNTPDNVADYGNPHDVDNTYAWSSSGFTVVSSQEVKGSLHQVRAVHDALRPATWQ
ncbi:MAG: hypothetical protein ABI629_21535 [bacterium]